MMMSLQTEKKDINKEGNKTVYFMTHILGVCSPIETIPNSLVRINHPSVHRSIFLQHATMLFTFCLFYL